MRLFIGHKYRCKAVEILSYGAVTEFEDGSTQLLHISNVAEAFVKDVNNYITVGDTYEVTAIPGKVRPIEITLRQVDIEPEDESDLENMDFGELLNMYPPTNSDLRNKRDGSRKKRR